MMLMIQLYLYFIVILQGDHGKRTLREIGTFLRYMETRDNVKASKSA